MTAFLDEAQAEIALLDLLREPSLGYGYAFGPDIAPDGTRPERTGYDQVVLVGRLRAALAVVPPAEVLRHAGVIMAPLMDQIVESNLEARTLTTLRDTLLPKLLSGAVRVGQTGNCDASLLASREA